VEGRRKERVCPRCGHSVGQTRFCPDCGFELGVVGEGAQLPTREEWDRRTARRSGAKANAEGGAASPPGWYVSRHGGERYWDGTQWTDRWRDEAGGGIREDTSQRAREAETTRLGEGREKRGVADRRSGGNRRLGPVAGLIGVLALLGIVGLVSLSNSGSRDEEPLASPEVKPATGGSARSFSSRPASSGAPTSRTSR